MRNGLYSWLSTTLGLSNPIEYEWEYLFRVVCVDCTVNIYTCRNIPFTISHVCFSERSLPPQGSIEILLNKRVKAVNVSLVPNMKLVWVNPSNCRDNRSHYCPSVCFFQPFSWTCRKKNSFWFVPVMLFIICIHRKHTENKYESSFSALPLCLCDVCYDWVPADTHCCISQSLLINFPHDDGAT